MKRILYPTLCTLALTSALLSSATHAQSGDKPAPSPIIIRFQAHAMNANDFQIRRSKDRSLEAQIKSKGMDVACTEWIQRDHPYIFAEECIKQTG